MSNIAVCTNFKLPHATTTKNEGDMRAAANISKHLAKQGIDAGRMLFLKQVHSADIETINSETDFLKYSQKRYEADAWILSHPNTGCAVYTADCAPVFLWDKSHSVLGLAHSGWKPTVKNIAGKTAAALSMHPLKNGKINASIGPHIRQCCFEFGKEAHDLFDASVIEERKGKLFVSLEKQIIFQLIDAGIEKDDIHLSGICTYCNNNFFSYRRDKSDRAIMSYIFKEAK